MRKLLYIPFFFLLSATIYANALNFAVGSSSSSIAQHASQAADFSQSRVAEFTAEFIANKFSPSLVNIEPSAIDTSIAESYDFTDLNNSSTAAISQWISGSSEELDLSATSGAVDELLSQASAGIADSIAKLPECRDVSEYTNIESAACNPGSAVVDRDLGQLDSELAQSTTQAVEPPVWLSLIKTVYSLSGGVAYFMVIASIVFYAVIVLSYGNLAKGMRKAGRALAVQSVIIALLGLVGLVMSSAVILLSGDTIAEVIVVAAGLGIWREWQSMIVILAGIGVVIGLVFYITGKMLRSIHSSRAKKSTRAGQNISQVDDSEWSLDDELEPPMPEESQPSSAQNSVPKSPQAKRKLQSRE